MSTNDVALVVPAETALAVVELENAAREYATQAKAPNSLRAYRADWRLFEAWANEHGFCPLPATPQTVALYATALAKVPHKVSTIGRKLVSISRAHKLAGHDPSPTASAHVREILKGIRRELGSAPTQKAPICIPELRAMTEVTPNRMLGLRDRALLLIGFAGAFRRSELVALNVEDVRETADGLEVIIRRSKTDQEAKGRKIGLPYGSSPSTCPVRAYRAWLAKLPVPPGLTLDGPIFRRITKHGKNGGRVLNARLSSKGVAFVVKRWALAAGYDPKLFAGHSLRAGLLTAAAKAGKDRRVLKKQSGHRSDAILDLYIRDGELFSDNAATGIGL